MDKRTQAQIILEELDKQYSIPTYMERYAIKGIIAGLNRIEGKANDISGKYATGTTNIT